MIVYFAAPGCSNRRVPCLRTTLLTTCAVACAAACGTEAPFGDPVPDEAGEALFDPAVLHDVALDLPDWMTLKANFQANTYYHAGATIDGHAILDIGVRSRGNGTRNFAKPGLKLDFNNFNGDRRFGRLKSLVLENFYGDPSCLREHLSFYVTQQLGIESPRTSYARVTVNGTYVGLYAIVESVDKVFLTAHFNGNDGNLFKFEVMSEPYDLGLRASYSPVPFEPKTHESTPDLAPLNAFMNAITNSPSDGYAASLEPFIDPRHVLTYYAAEIATVQTDGLTGFLGVNNFFLYQPASDQRFVLIPWDRDYAFARSEHPIFFRSDTNILIRRLLEDATLRDDYLATLKSIVNNHVTTAALRPRLDAAYALIRDSVAEDPNKLADPPFEDQVAVVRASIAARAEDVAHQLP